MTLSFSPEYTCGYKKGDYLRRASDRPTHIYYLQEGLVSVCRLSEDGEEEIVRYVRPGTFIGAPSLFLANRKILEPDISIRACSDCRVSRMPFSHFLEQARRSPHILEEIIVEMALEDRYFRLLMDYIAYHRSANALALLLTTLLDEEEATGSAYVSAHTTYTDMARYLKIHKNTVSRILRKYVELGVLKKIDGRLQVVDRNALEAYAAGKELVYWSRKS